MRGLVAVFKKELADHFSSKRFIILFALIVLAGLSAIYTAAQSIRGALAEDPSSRFIFLRLFTASSGVLPPFVSFIGFLGPLVGLALGFDAVNSEHSSGTLSRVLSQPLFRDSVINGKFLAGLTTVAIMLASIFLIVSGMGLAMIGVPPTQEEILRLLGFLGLAIVYVAFWMSLSVLFSIVFRRAATSALAGIAVWIFFAFFMSLIAGVAADSIAPVNDQADTAAAVKHENARQSIDRLSPTTLFNEATITLLTPGVRSLGPVLVRQVMGMVFTPLPLSQSLLIVWPHLVGLVAITLICFALSYVMFMKQEIRAP